MTFRSPLVARALGGAAVVVGVGAGAQVPQSPQAPPVPQGQPAARCRVDGRVTSGSVPLPGVSVVVHVGDALKAATSTDIDGKYTILFAPSATYHLSADLSGFATGERDLALQEPPCNQAVDFQLALRPRTEALAAAVPAETAQAPAGQPAQAPAPPSQTEAAESSAQAPQAGPGVQSGQQSARGAGGRGQGAGGGRAGRGGGQAGQGGQGFQTLNVQTDANGAATLDEARAQDTSEDATRLLPSGFSLQSAQADAIAINGSADATNLDRGQLQGRLQVIDAGQLDPATGQLAPGFAGAGAGAGGGQGGPGGFLGGRGGGPGRGGFVLGGRGARGQSPYQGSATYTFGGSVLNAAPYEVRSDVASAQPSYAQNNFGGTFGGPLKIPGLYADTNRRTNFQLNYTGSRSNNLFDQYATVPTVAERNGDFSASSIQLVNPMTGQPFVGNQIPQNLISPVAASLLQFMPAPNLPGTTNNYHVSTTAQSSSEAFSVRLTQNLSPTVVQGQGGRGGPGGRGGFGGGFGGPGRGGGNGPRPTNIVLSAQLQYRHNDTRGLNVFPGLGGETVTTSIAAPVSLNVTHGRSVHIFTVNMTHAAVDTTNAFTNNENVAGLAGIQYPAAAVASTDPVNFGVPNITFSGFTGIRGASASQRTDDRLTTSYTWLHTLPRQQIRIGGDYRRDMSDAETNANARGTFTFTGAYSSGQPQTLGATGADFADFLLGLPQQATLQSGGTSHLRQNAFDGFIEDNWQKSAKLTLNLGLRYELWMPYTEINGRMANLDATSNLSAVAPVLPGEVGPYTGAFPAGLLNADKHNLGPRLGFAYRVRPTTILRGGYSITYNSGAYASIARQLVGQPPFSDTETFTGTDEAPLSLAEALLAPSSGTTNNWGVDKDYALGMIQTWNGTVVRNLNQNWVVTGGYTGIKGSDLDILRAPDLGAGGVPIAGTQAFIWESSGGRSNMNAGNLQIQRRLAGGYSGVLSYTVAKAMDNASSLGAGGPVVAQNDNNLAAEYAPSNFDRRQQLSGTFYYELPWGPNRRWLKNGGLVATLFGEWSAQFNLTVQTGTPLTARVLGAASDLLRGVNGSLRANYNGGPVQLPDPTVSEFFNVNAFSIPAPGQFGDSSRNMIVGPGTRQLNGLFQRDLRIGGTRALTLQVNALNLLDTVQWASVDTNINSPTFGQVLSARPMRTITVTARIRF